MEETPEVVVSKWVAKIRAMQSLSDVPDERIGLMGDLSEIQVRKYLGDAYTQFETDMRLDYAVCAFAISKLILGSRSVNEGSSIHRTQGFGQGEVTASEVGEIIRISKRWEEIAYQVLGQLRSEIPAEVGWVDV